MLFRTIWGFVVGVFGHLVGLVVAVAVFAIIHLMSIGNWLSALVLGIAAIIGVLFLLHNWDTPTYGLLWVVMATLATPIAFIVIRIIGEAIWHDSATFMSAGFENSLLLSFCVSGVLASIIALSAHIPKPRF